MDSIFFWFASFSFFSFACWRLRQALLIIPLFFPLYLVKTSVAGIPLTLIEVFIYAVLAVYGLQYAAVLFKKASGRKKDTSREKNTPTLPWFLYTCIALFVIGSFVGLLQVLPTQTLNDGTVFEGFKMALGIIKGWIVAPIILFFLWLRVISDQKDIYTLLNSYTASSGVLAVWALWQVISNNYITLDARASGPFESANYLALYIGPAVVYSIIQFSISFLEQRPLLWNRKNALWLAVSLLLGSALLFSKSYAAMIAVVVALACYFTIQWRPKSKTKSPATRNFYAKTSKRSHLLYWLLGGGLMMGILLFLVFSIDPAKWQAMFRFEERSSSSVRIEVYTVSFDLLQRNWLLGIGPGQFSARYDLEATSILGHPPYESTMLHPHNIFLATWLNLGLLGFVGFMGILLYAFGKARWRAGQALDSHSQQVIVIGIVLLLEILIHGLFDTPLFKNDLALLFWLISGTIVMGSRSSPSQTPTTLQ